MRTLPRLAAIAPKNPNGHRPSGKLKANVNRKTLKFKAAMIDASNRHAPEQPAIHFTSVTLAYPQLGAQRGAEPARVYFTVEFRNQLYSSCWAEISDRGPEGIVVGSPQGYAGEVNQARFTTAVLAYLDFVLDHQTILDARWSKESNEIERRICLSL
jgi:hypothetical protein